MTGTRTYRALYLMLYSDDKELQRALYEKVDALDWGADGAIMFKTITEHADGRVEVS